MRQRLGVVTLTRFEAPAARTGYRGRRYARGFSGLETIASRPHAGTALG